MAVDPYTNMKISNPEQGFLNRIRPYRTPLMYFMFYTFFVVVFVLILSDFIPDEMAIDNIYYEGFMTVVLYLFWFFHILMILSPLVAMALYPEYRVMFFVMGVVLWVLTASFWIFFLSLPG